MKINALLKTAVFLTVVSGFLFACVPARKFEDVKAEKESCERERAELKKQNESLTTANNELKAAIAKNERDIAALIADTAFKSNSNRMLTLQFKRPAMNFKQKRMNLENSKLA